MERVERVEFACLANKLSDLHHGMAVAGGDGGVDQEFGVARSSATAAPKDRRSAGFNAGHVRLDRPPNGV
jgi:hypothetical protein